MPWCEECAKYLAPTAMNADGTCPTCGRPIGQTEQRAAEQASEERAPWHFKLLVALVVVYLGWRFLELFGAL